MKIAASAATATFALALAAVTGAQVAGPRPADTFLRRSADEMQVKIFDQAQGEWRQVVELVYRRQPF